MARLGTAPTPRVAQRRRAQIDVRPLQRALPLAPAVLMLGVFLAGPIVWSLYSAFTNAALTGPNAQNPQWVGGANFAKLFTDPTFPNALWLTLVFVLFSAIIGQNGLGMALALLMQVSGRTIARLTGTIVVVAWILPEIVAAFALYAFFVGDGMLDQGMAIIGLAPGNWLYTAPLVAVILANIWRGTAFSMMIYQAAFSGIPDDVLEAAQIDGAGAWQRFTRVSLPMIRTSIGTNLMLITLQTLSVFTLVWVMTKGGPSNRSMILPVYAYEQAFSFYDIGYGSAIATVMLLVGAVFGLTYVRLLRTED
ncbi:carbohydrate ABC transporter permease [uncultured Tessaracoccus sp.]|uniref:carbohydrate ABC transporter permease n=1 Tax=uncultured Tessaracoccus sp. TaxID=905023 RepID=UPI00261E1A9B|nr:sugar ABC transporter permease [uncultured Tessaracoccus sp.]